MTPAATPSPGTSNTTTTSASRPRRSTATSAAADLVTPEPRKKPKSSYIRFASEQPNETWQADYTYWQLANGVTVEILCWIDDHSRYAISVTAHLRVTGHTVLTTFRHAIEQHGEPFSTLTDNGMVFTTRFSGGKGGRNTFEAELVRRRIIQKNSRPNHPTTCGKVCEDLWSVAPALV